MTMHSTTTRALVLSAVFLVLSGILPQLGDPTTGSAATQGGFTLNITDGRESVRPGDGLIYAVSVSSTTQVTRDVTLTLPSQVDVISVNDGGVQQDSLIRWNNVVIDSATQTFLVQVNVKPTASTGTTLQATARSATLLATDMTVIRPLRPDHRTAFDVDLTAESDSASAGELVTYQARISLNASAPRTEDIVITLPQSTVIPRLPSGAVLRIDGFEIPQVLFTPGDDYLLTFDVQLPERLRSLRPLRAAATVGDANDIVWTEVTSVTPAPLSVTIDNRKATAAPGEILTYWIRVRNATDDPLTGNYLTASLPIYAEFIDATEGGYWQGDTVRWAGLAIAPHDERNVSFTMRIRSDAPAGHRLLAGASIAGLRASDLTIVNGGAAFGATNSASSAMSNTSSVSSSVSSANPAAAGNASSTNAAASAANTSGNGNIAGAGTANGSGNGNANATANDALITKKAHATATAPGGIIRYSLTVRNVLVSTLRGSVVMDTFDPLLLRVVDAGSATIKKDGELSWNVPDLAPGATWTTDYALGVRGSAKIGVTIANTATIDGQGLNALAVADRTSVASVPVRSPLASSGAPLVLLSAYLAFPFAAGSVAVRKLRRIV